MPDVPDWPETVLDLSAAERRRWMLVDPNRMLAQEWTERQRRRAVFERAAREHARRTWYRGLARWARAAFTARVTTSTPREESRMTDGSRPPFDDVMDLFAARANSGALDAPPPSPGEPTTDDERTTS